MFTSCDLINELLDAVIELANLAEPSASGIFVSMLSFSMLDLDLGEFLLGLLHFKDQPSIGLVELVGRLLDADGTEALNGDITPFFVVGVTLKVLRAEHGIEAHLLGRWCLMHLT